ncbi:hypothetical protein G6L28_14965 [Agrobacterium larrymoorei]|uniref:hypothetical protein n=1 Tax=Agrobacterium larrymoorei TaxID=160699 RepID=UPI001572A85C|nr:hypothetical protein [Agrobacterium larrymoorei]NTJ43900.1 hypothetical protein [Agrobacterium larrymoorei]
MADDSTTTVRATFKTRQEADLAVEHLVQQYGVSRPDIFIQSATSANTAGSEPSGGDVTGDEERDDAPLNGEIEVSADISVSQLSAVQRRMGEAGALRVTGH